MASPRSRRRCGGCKRAGGLLSFPTCRTCPWIRMICHGATPRKFEPDRWRCTTGAGAPRKRLVDETGLP
eukprot:4739391-Pleurochrysis_carterae.AAC.1